jgi:hypothetical protein
VEDGEQWNNAEWYWDEQYNTWVFTGPKRKRRKDLTNKMEKNWLLGMRRNWETDKKAKMVAKITVKRDELHTVRPCSSAQMNYNNV